MFAPQFLESDLSDEVPSPGIYVSTVAAARMRASRSGNAMVQVVHELESVSPGYERVSEYFVLEGVSARGLVFSRRRLVELFRACGVPPRAGDEITLERIVGARLRVKVEHEEWRGELQLRVVAHLPPLESQAAL